MNILRIKKTPLIYLASLACEIPCHFYTKLQLLRPDPYEGSLKRIELENSEEEYKNKQTNKPTENNGNQIAEVSYNSFKG